MRKSAVDAGALDTLRHFLHGDAIDKKVTSHFVTDKGAAERYTKPLVRGWFPREHRSGRGVR